MPCECQPGRIIVLIGNNKKRAANIKYSHYKETSILEFFSAFIVYYESSVISSNTIKKTVSIGTVLKT